MHLERWVRCSRITFTTCVSLIRRSNLNSVALSTIPKRVSDKTAAHLRTGSPGGHGDPLATGMSWVLPEPLPSWAASACVARGGSLPPCPHQICSSWRALEGGPLLLEGTLWTIHIHIHSHPLGQNRVTRPPQQRQGCWGSKCLFWVAVCQRVGARYQGEKGRKHVGQSQ